jgi:hypothetical protein
VLPQSDRQKKGKEKSSREPLPLLDRMLSSSIATNKDTAARSSSITHKKRWSGASLVCRFAQISSINAHHVPAIFAQTPYHLSHDANALSPNRHATSLVGIALRLRSNLRHFLCILLVHAHSSLQQALLHRAAGLSV